MELTNKVVLVTGASMGIGLEIARTLVGKGCRVAFTARSLDKLQQAVADVGGGAIAVRMDVTDADSVRAAVAEVEERLGPIDVLVNNAGNGGPMARWYDRDADYLRRVFDVHVLGTERVMRAVAPSMVARGTGTIVNFTSTLGYVAMPGTAEYNAAKAAVIMLSRTVRAELEPRGVDVRLFGPPHTKTKTQELPLNLPKMFEPSWVAERFVRFLEGRRAEVLSGGNESLLFIQRVSPRLASYIMESIGFAALERVERALPARAASSEVAP